jgi:hypothetical protein
MHKGRERRLRLVKLVKPKLRGGLFVQGCVPNLEFLFMVFVGSLFFNHFLLFCGGRGQRALVTWAKKVIGIWIWIWL